MTQAPTPGPLSGEIDELAKKLCQACWPGKSWDVSDLSRAYWRRKARESLAPTAPVEASGSERLWPVGSWLSAALDDPKVCEAMKADIREWFDNGGHLRPQPSGETRERAEKLASALNDLIPAVRAYLMTGDVMSQGIKKNTWEPVLKRAQAALTFDPPTTDATTASALSATIRTSLLGVAPDDQDVTLEDSDWRLILGALEGRK